MRNFVRDVAVFCFANLLVLGYLYGIYDVSNDYLASINDKLDRLSASDARLAANGTQSNTGQSNTGSSGRILFVGGSSVAWGTHSRIVEAELGLEPTNMAYHAAMGLGVRIEEAKQLSAPGDVVVFSSEWSVLGDAPWNRKMTEVLLSCPRAARFMSGRDLKLAMDGLLPAMRMPFVAAFEDMKRNGLRGLTYQSAQARRQHHLRGSFNEYGDYEGHYEREVVGIEGMIVRKPTADEVRRSVERLNELNVELSARGTRLFYFIPIIPESRYREDQQIFDQFIGLIVDNLEFPVLNPKDFTYPNAAFFDSCYHMRKESGVDRTRLIIDRLRPHLAR